MTRWLFHSEVEGHLHFADGAKQTECSHPSGVYRAVVRSREGSDEPGVPLFDLYVLFDADDLESAGAAGRSHTREFIDTLTFVSGAHLIHVRDVMLCDWTRGNQMHDARLFQASTPNVSLATLDADLMRSASALLERERSDGVKRAMKWFAHGTRVAPPDEQFECFWAAIEILAQSSKSVQPVSDSCPRCRSPLYCRECEMVPTHRPYASQAIRELIRTHGGDGADELFEDASAFRHALKHGEPLRPTEESRRQKISDLVDPLARVAWRAIAICIVPPDRRVAVLAPTTYLYRRARATLFMSFGTPPDREPQLDDLPKMNLSIIKSTVDREPRQSGPTITGPSPGPS